MLRILALLSVLSVACGATDTDSIEPAGAPVVVAETPEAVETVETVEAAAPACRVVFSPEESLRAETTEAAARWSKATGCEITVGEGGIPVRSVADLGLSPNGTRAHGVTHCPDTSVPCTRSRLVIELIPEHKAAALAHEMGHALPAIMSHIEGDEHALMGHAGGDGMILSADLVQICSVLRCQAFAPEL